MLTGEDITASREVSHAILFVFDADEQYRYTVRADSNQVRQRIPIPITLKNTDHYWLSVWGNLDGNQCITQLEPSNTLDNPTVSASGKEGGNRSDLPGREDAVLCFHRHFPVGKGNDPFIRHCHGCIPDGVPLLLQEG